MEKAEAAEFLGVSVRTVERLAASGRLTKRQSRKKTRPSVVFDREELTALKEVLATSPSEEETAKTEGENPAQRHVGFRLDPYYADALAKAGAAHRMSAGEYARRLVISAIEQNPDGPVLDEIRALKAAVNQPRNATSEGERVVREIETLKLGLASAMREFAVRFGMDDGEAQQMIARSLLKGWKRA